MEKKYKCLKCGKALKRENIDFSRIIKQVDCFGLPIGLDFPNIHKNCGGEVEELMEIDEKNLTEGERGVK